MSENETLSKFETKTAQVIIGVDLHNLEMKSVDNFEEILKATGLVSVPHWLHQGYRIVGKLLTGGHEYELANLENFAQSVKSQLNEMGIAGPIQPVKLHVIPTRNVLE